MSLLKESIKQAWDARLNLMEQLVASATDSYRLFHGTVEGFSGLTIDRYGDAILVQTFHQSLTTEDLSAIENFYRDDAGLGAEVFYNDRSLPGSRYANALSAEQQQAAKTPRTIQELGVKFVSRLRHRGQDPLLFLDLRASRRFLYGVCAGKTVLNLFSYTCGAGVGALWSGARQVTNVDFAESSLEYGRQNAALNGLDETQIEFIEDDFFAVVRQFAGLPLGGRKRKGERMLLGTSQRSARQFDLVFLDPPRWAKSKYGTVDLIRDYGSVFKPSLLSVADGGLLICTNNVASVDAAQWQDLLQRSAKKAGRALKSLEIIAPEADFPSFDGAPPLKVAVLSV